MYTVSMARRLFLLEISYYEQYSLVTCSISEIEKVKNVLSEKVQPPEQPPKKKEEPDSGRNVYGF